MIDKRHVSYSEWSNITDRLCTHRPIVSEPINCTVIMPSATDQHINISQLFNSIAIQELNQLLEVMRTAVIHSRKSNQPNFF